MLLCTGWSNDNWNYKNVSRITWKTVVKDQNNLGLIAGLNTGECGLKAMTMFRNALQTRDLSFIFLCRSMACLLPPVPSDLTSFLTASLPRGFAVGPSQLCQGRLGLWWVGRPLQAGSLLGRDAEWASKCHRDPVIHSRGSEPRAAQTSSSEDEKVTSVLWVLFLKMEYWSIKMFNLSAVGSRWFFYVKRTNRRVIS